MSPRSAANDATTMYSDEQAASPASGAHRVAPSRPTERASVQEYFDRLAQAATRGDLKTVVQLWGVPAFVVGSREARVVQSEADVEQMFGDTQDIFNQRGITEVHPEITALDWVSRDLVLATVRFSYVGLDEREVDSESSTYTLLRGENGTFKLRSIVLRGSGNDVPVDG